MTSRGTTQSRGFAKIDALVSDGYRVVDVDSDDTFVGVRLSRGDETTTVLLSHADFVHVFPGLARIMDPLGDDSGR